MHNSTASVFLQQTQAAERSADLAFAGSFLVLSILNVVARAAMRALTNHIMAQDLSEAAAVTRVVLHQVHVQASLLCAEVGAPPLLARVVVLVCF